MTEHDRVNVLLVDDQPGKLLSYEAVLAELGENLIKAESAREALHRLLEHDIAVVLVDVCMPEFDGFDLVSMIRQHPRFDRTAIILVSAILMSDVDRLKGYERGAIDYMSVPIVPEILRAKVAAFSDLYRKTRQLERVNEELERRVAARTLELEASAARLRAGEERLRLAIAAGSVATLVYDVAQDRLVGDEMLAYFLDLSDEDVTRGIPLARALDAVEKSDRDAVAARVDEALAAGEECLIECRVRTADGETRWIRARGRVERDASGRATRLPGAIVDVTEQVRMREELRAADRRKDVFLAMLSHELRNPVASIRNAIEIMNGVRLDDPAVTFSRDVINRQILALTRLVDDLLDVSRITQSKIRLHPDALRLDVVVNEAIEAASPFIRARGHELAVRLPDAPIWVDGDGVRLAQVFQNLLNNAAKYQDEGGRIELVVEGAGDEAVVRVRDHGLGIEPAMLGSIFDLFVQEEGTSDRAQGGLGIGLSLVKTLVELHGGSVEARSEGRRKGSEFSVRLPARRPPAARSPAKPLRSPRARRGPPLRVLVVDDNEDAAESLAVLLRREGHVVALAHDGETALERAARLRPDVIFLDIGLPRMSGLDVCRGLRALGFASERIIATSGYAEEADRRSSAEAGFGLHLVKPVEPSAIYRVLDEIGSATDRTMSEG